MSLYLSPKNMAQLSVKSIYRLLVKNAKYYPSKNRFQIELSIREEIISKLQMNKKSIQKLKKQKWDQPIFCFIKISKKKLMNIINFNHQNNVKLSIQKMMDLFIFDFIIKIQ